MWTVTGEAKPFAAVAWTESAVPVVPSTSVCDVGVTVKEKSGGGGGGGGGAAVVVSAPVALWLSMPEVPVSVTVAVSVATVASAANVIFFATPAASVSVAGVA